MSQIHCLKYHQLDNPMMDLEPNVEKWLLGPNKREKNVMNVTMKITYEFMGKF